MSVQKVKQKTRKLPSLKELYTSAPIRIIDGLITRVSDEVGVIIMSRTIMGKSKPMRGLTTLFIADNMDAPSGKIAKAVCCSVNTVSNIKLYLRKKQQLTGGGE